MVTVTNAHVKVRYLTDEWPAGVNDANVTALCAIAEARTDSKVGVSGTFPHTTLEGIEFNVDVVVQMIEYGKWVHGGMVNSGIPPPPLFTREMLDRIETILQTTSMIDLLDTTADPTT